MNSEQFQRYNEARWCIQRDLDYLEELASALYTVGNGVLGGNIIGVAERVRTELDEIDQAVCQGIADLASAAHDEALTLIPSCLAAMMNKKEV
jgi:hypothetical protein